MAPKKLSEQTTLTADSISSRSQQLKKQLKVVTPPPPSTQDKASSLPTLSPIPSPTIMFTDTALNVSTPSPILSPTEAELRQQLLFSQQRRLLDDFLREIPTMLRHMAKLYLGDLSSMQRRTITKPQVFLSYAWEEQGSARLKQLQDVFLRDTLAKDLRCSGLNPWLDKEKMVGHMDGQMRDNVTDSQFVVLIGTQRYAERTKIEKCGLLYLPSGSFKVKDSVENLPIEYNNFYLRVDKQLFYIWDKAKNQYKAVELAHEDNLTLFDGVFNLSPITISKAKQLTSDELAEITRITRHERRTNVRKELEFTLKRAEKSNNFLLPLLLEGDWGSTFPEISKDYFVYDSRTWFSLDKGWLKFEEYIHGLTQLSPLGILPAVLGLNQPTHPEYRKACREAYEKLYSNLALKLHLLSLSPVDEKLSPTPLPNTTSTFASSSSTSLSTPSSAPASSSTNSTSTLTTTSPFFSSSSLSSSSTTTSSSSSVTPSTDSSPTSPPSSGSRFFQSQKPDIIKTEAPSELKEDCINKFQKLFDDHSYAFTVKRANVKQLVLQFTAKDEVLEDDEDIKKELFAAAKILQSLVTASGIILKPNQFKPDWKNWRLTIEATSAEIDGVAWLLQTASGKYITDDNPPKDYEASCRMQ